MKALALLVAVSACAMDGAGVDTLPHDTYYSQPFTGQCGGPNTPPQWCVPQLSLCASGSYGYLLGDVITYGSYHLENELAVATSSTVAPGFTFDLSTRIMTQDGDVVSTAPWTVVPFVGDVDCTYNMP